MASQNQEYIGNQKSRVWEPAWSGENKSVEPFNPSDIQRYLGKTFVIANHEYSLTQDGKFSGRPSTGIEGSRVVKIGGLYLDDARIFGVHLTQMKRLNAESWLAKYGLPLEENKGLCLAITISEEDEKRANKIGFITNPVTKII